MRACSMLSKGTSFFFNFLDQQIPMTIEIRHFTRHFQRERALTIALIRYCKVLCKDK